MSALKIVKTEEEVDQLIKHCQYTRYCSFDFETTSLDSWAISHNEYPLTIAISFQPGSSWVVPLGHPESPFLNCWERILRKIGKALMENWDIIKVCWNLKFEYKWCMKYGIYMKGRLFDGMLAKYCLREEKPMGLKEFVAEWFPEYAGYAKEINKANLRNEPLEKVCKYNGEDSDLTLRAWVLILEPRLIKKGFYNLFRNLLMMLTRVLAESEFAGVLIDRPYLVGLIDKYKIKIAEADKKLRSTPSLLKFERDFRRARIRKLIKNIKLEIEELLDEDAERNARMVANREKKIAGILSGKPLNKKEGKFIMADGINLKSPDQLRLFLFQSKHGLKLPIVKYTKDKKTKKSTDKPSTDEHTLLELKKKDKTGFMQNLLDYREITKLDSTYISGMYKWLDENDRIHANFLIHGTVTGRLSCREPNLQNIPRDTTASEIKQMFITPPGMILVEVDYSQAELRILAERAEDKAMIEIFRKNYNIHVATACKLHGGIHLYDKVKEILKVADTMSGIELAKPENKKYLKWAKRKKEGKTTNFCIVYQQGDHQTAEDLGIEIQEARDLKLKWFEEYPQAKEWINNQKDFVDEHGYVTNMFGRKRRLLDVFSGDEGSIQKAYRDAINAPIQGDASDFGSLSEIVIRDKKLRGELPPELPQTWAVHDSIGFYTFPHLVHKLIPKLIKICDNPETKKYFGFELKHVKMKVSPECGVKWGSMGGYDAWTDYSKMVMEKDTIKK